MSLSADRLAALRLSRRDFLCRSGMGMASLGLAGLMASRGMLHAGEPGAAVAPLAPKAPPLPARAKRVIHLFMNGGPSHVDTFDPKPMLDKFAGKPLPRENPKTERK